ncbi:3-keto-5-aminohexanoate cleavage protein [Vibrio sp. S9_S30]|uniref:3-keto-5-aminohexanoate cleavage protein n=1 Tax=Vibrio sp. S9_S30 TaxID=2720226 RepID=UPI001680832C|nr:3-keto-5-aminohexanoate cleavage protein [Vibrio sp. S9_S30]MBD1556484.1 3-keto-5-aminohexanoate cleavage protein [Vibrio sp. S9_S30]
MPAIIVAPNGARKTKGDHPNLPMSVEDVVKDVQACARAGAAMAHVHARTLEGKHTLGIRENAALLAALKAELGNQILIQLTTEAIGQFSRLEQMRLIEKVLPPAVSCAIKELIPDKASEATARDFFHLANQENILIQWIVYDQNDLIRYFDLLNRQVIPNTNQHLLLVLGRYHKHLESQPTDLLPMLTPQLLNSDIAWGVCAFGRLEQQCLISAMLLGGDARVGFENNHYLPNGELSPGNECQVAQLVQQATALNVNLIDARKFESILKCN